MSSEKTKKYSYYPGCSQEVTNRAYDVSSRNTARVLGLEMFELDDWNCCGATAYYPVRDKKYFMMAARNLAIAEKGSTDLITICNGCYAVLMKTFKYLEGSDDLMKEIRNALKAGDMDYEGKIRIRHILDVFVNDLGEEEIQNHVVRNLNGMKIAPYYGCLFGRPFGDLPEYPMMMDEMINWLGGIPVPYPMKSRCCGGMLMTSEPKIAMNMVGKLLRNAINAEADCIATCCPLCQINLEGYQKKISAQMGQDCYIPVLYITQLMGHAFGLAPREIALDDSLSDVSKLFAWEGKGK